MQQTKDQQELTQLIIKRSPGYLAMGFLVVLFLVTGFFYFWYTSVKSRTVPRLDLEGVCYYGDNTQQQFRTLDDIDCTGESVIYVVGHVKESIPREEEIYFRVHRERVRVYVNHVKVLDASSAWHKKWESFRVDHLKPTDRIEIKINGMVGVDADTSVEKTLQSICYGNRYDIFWQQLTNKFPKICLCSLILILGLAELLTAMTFVLISSNDIRGSVSCGLLLITGAICCFIDYDYIGLLVQKVNILHIVDVVVQIATCFFLMVNIRFHMRTKKGWLMARNMIYCWMVLMILCMAGNAIVPYQHNEATWISGMASLTAGVILTEMIMLIMDYRKCREKQMPYVVGASWVITTCLLIEIASFVIHYYFFGYVFLIGLAAYAALQYIIIFHQAKEREQRSQLAAELEKELVDSRVAIMLSQIRPHFLYNSITAIQTLCVQDPEQARKSLGDFAKYLRGNMDSLASRELIPFAKELEHTRHYVELESIRQGEFLKVEYHIEETDFMIPTLTLQPLVENAIQHGVGAKEEGGTVVISTSVHGNQIQIVVEDDGVGFDYAKIEQEEQDPQRSHIGMRNVQQRIEKMAKGMLIIRSRVGVGTKATILLPKETKE